MGLNVSMLAGVKALTDGTTETLICETCNRDWQRTVVRGRKPRICEHCRGWGYKPTPVPRTRTRPAVPPGSILDVPPVSPSPVVYTDGGREPEHKWEKNDCTVRALATATNQPYAMAHEFMSRNGRRPGSGAFFHSIVARHKGKVLGYKLEEVRPVARARGLRTFLYRNPQFRQGTWILQMSRHVATLKDGKLLDSFDSSAKEIRGAWKVFPA